MSLDRRFHEAPCGLLTTTASGEIVEVNDTFVRWTGFAVAELVGRPFVSLLDPSSRLFYETRHGQVLHLQGSVAEVALTVRRADGSVLPVLLNSTVVRDGGTSIVRTAVFNATERLAYERELLQARRSAEQSEARVRILQDITGTFGMSSSDQEVVDSFVKAARGAFAATEAAVMLLDEENVLYLAAGVNPLFGVVPQIDALRDTRYEVVVTVDDAETLYPELAAGLRAERMEALSIAPLDSDTQRLGLLVCFFGRRSDFDEGFFEMQRALGRQAAQTLVRLRLQRRLEHLALFDQLTGVPNRQHVEQSLESAVEEAQSTGQPVTLIFIDVDEFKTVNDRYGHTAGDVVLHDLAQRLRDGVREHDVIGRIGGDEFIAICPGADAHAATAIASRILALAREPIDAAPGGLRVSVSIGIAMYDPATDARPTPDQMLIRADDAMYTSKGTGKDRVSLERQLRGPDAAA